MEGLHAALEFARANAHERDAVAVVFVHVRLDFEHEAAEIVALRVDLFAGERVGVRQRAWRQAQEFLQKGLDAEVRERRTEEHRRKLSAAHSGVVELVARTVEQLDVIHQVLVVRLADELAQLGRTELSFDFGNLLRGVRVAVALERDHAARLAVEHAAEVLAATDGPVHGIRANAEHRLDFLHEIKRVARLAVKLVHERENRDVAQRADFEKLFGLRLDALGGVDDHDGGVGSHERSIRVFGKVLVARGVKDVHAAAVIGELQHRRRDRNAALLFDVHPVGHGMFGRRFAFDRAGGLNAAGIEQQLFGERGFACVRVRNNRERAARGDLVGKWCHGGPFYGCARCDVRRKAAGDAGECIRTVHYIPGGAARRRVQQNT